MDTARNNLRLSEYSRISADEITQLVKEAFSWI
jgi:hypothetical protein